LVDASKVNSTSAVLYEGDAYRHLAPRYDPLSGEGARIHGGRFNPPESFPTLYLCSSRECAVAELRRLGQRQVFGIQGLMPRRLFRYELRLQRVLDLCDAGVLERLGIAGQELVGEDRSLTRALGEAAYAASFQAVRSPSATGVGQILAVFPELLGAGELEAQLVGEWADVRDVG